MHKNAQESRNILGCLKHQFTENAEKPNQFLYWTSVVRNIGEYFGLCLYLRISISAFLFLYSVIKFLIFLPSYVYLNLILLSYVFLAKLRECFFQILKLLFSSCESRVLVTVPRALADSQFTSPGRVFIHKGAYTRLKQLFIISSLLS